MNESVRPLGGIPLAGVNYSADVDGLWRSLVTALDWGSRGPGFKSRQPDSESPGQGV